MPATFQEICNLTIDMSSVVNQTDQLLILGRLVKSQCDHSLAEMEISFNGTNYDIRQFIDFLYWFDFGSMEYERPVPFRRYLVENPFYLATFFIALFAFICNIICLFVMFRITTTMSGHRLFIMSLCLSDTIICILSVLHLRVLYLREFIRSPIDLDLCQENITTAFLYSGFLLSLFNLIGMATDHFVGILRPLYYCQWMSTRNTTLALITIWILGFVVGCAPYVIAFFPFVATGVDYCRTALTYGYYYYPGILMVATPIAFGIIFFSYLRIFRKIGDLHRRTPRLLSQIEITKATITTLLIVVTFAICWMPWCIVEFYQTIYLRLIKPPLEKVEWKSHKLAGRISLVLLVLNALADPLIYTFRMSQFRSRMAHVLCIEAIRQRLRRSRGLSLSGLGHHRLVTQSGGAGVSHHDAKAVSSAMKQSQTVPNALFSAPVAAIVCSVGAIITPDEHAHNGSISAPTPPNTLTTTTSCSGITSTSNQSASAIGFFLNGHSTSRSGSGQSDHLPPGLCINDESSRLLIGHVTLEEWQDEENHQNQEQDQDSPREGDHLLSENVFIESDLAETEKNNEETQQHSSTF